MKLLLSYPRSGNHLVRFLIEILTETPTLSLCNNKLDIPICENVFPESVPFNIKSVADYDENTLYAKSHVPVEEIPDELIFIIRNPREVLIRHCGEKIILEGWAGYESYFTSIDYYNNFQGKKCIFYYEDIVTDKVVFLNKLCSFLDNIKDEKQKYVFDNIDKLYELSKRGKKRVWGGINSSNNNVYYNSIKNMDFKIQFDNYIASKMSDPRYEMIKQKYDL